MTTQRNIDPLSCVSVFVEPIIQYQDCASINCGPATGFVVEKNGAYFLVTNYHVVSGRRSTDNSVISNMAGSPTHLKCTFHGVVLGTWEHRILPLYDGGSDPNSDKPLWRTPSLIGSSSFLYADVAILPLKGPGTVKLYPAQMDNKAQIKTSPCSRATVIGFPGARRSYKFFPIFVTGYVASEPELDYDNLPVVLIDATTTGGMSGSPVFQIEDGSYQDLNGNAHYEVGRFSKFLGIYSGRVPEVNLSDLSGETSSSTEKRQLSILNIGIVWKLSVIHALLDSILAVGIDATEL